MCCGAVCLQGFAARTKEVALITAVGIVVVLSGGKPASLGERQSVCLCVYMYIGSYVHVCTLRGVIWKWIFFSRKRNVDLAGEFVYNTVSGVQAAKYTCISKTNKQTNMGVFVVYHKHVYFMCISPLRVLDGHWTAQGLSQGDDPLLILPATVGCPKAR